MLLYIRISNTILACLCFLFITSSSFSQIEKQRPASVKQRNITSAAVSNLELSQEELAIANANKNLRTLQLKIERLQEEHSEALFLLEQITNNLESRKNISAKKISQAEAENDLLETLKQVEKEEGVGHMRTNLTLRPNKTSKVASTQDIKTRTQEVNGNNEQTSVDAAERQIYAAMQNDAASDKSITKAGIITRPLTAITSTPLDIESESRINNAAREEVIKITPLAKNERLIEERIDSSNALQKKIHRVILESVSQVDAERNLQLKKNADKNSPNTTMVISEVSATFNGGTTLITAQITEVNNNFDTTTISFPNHDYQAITTPKTRGGILTAVKLNGRDRAYLLFKAALRDKDFDKYYLYVLRNEQWKLVMNSFAIHKSNTTDSQSIIKINPENPNELLRYYSVYDIDEQSDSRFKWLLRQESVPVKSWQ